MFVYKTKKCLFLKVPGFLHRNCRKALTFPSTPLCVCLSGEGTLGGCGACWCVQVISRRRNQDQGWGEHFFNSKWFKPLASEDRGRLPLRKPLLKRELNMSELWISYDFKDAQILNTSGVSACPDVLQNSQKPEIVFHHFSFVMVKVLVLPFAFLFLCVYKDCLFFLFRPCQHVSRALPDCLTHSFCDPHPLFLRLLEERRK